MLARAQGEAERFTKLLKEYQQAEEVTRDRLYIDAIQSVLSQSSKVVVDVEGGNNLLYLPLDRLMQSSGDRREPRGIRVAAIDRRSGEREGKTRRDSA